MQQIVLLGFGNMGQALVKGWLARGHDPSTIRVVDPATAAREHARRLGVSSGPNCASVRTDEPVDVVVLAVKPAQLEAALQQSRELIKAADDGEGSVFLSIAAGKTTLSIASVLGARAAVVRAMPNTPAAIGKGMTVLTATAEVSDAQRKACERLMSAVGAVAWVEDERQMDAVTAVSGSGPAYVFLLIECLEQAAIEQGLDPELARELATVTAAGAGAYAERAGEDVATLRQRVTSPGGTTEAALNVLMAADGLQRLLSRAVRAATERSRKLATE